MKWMNENLISPERATQEKITGTVICQFIVRADGTVDEITIKSSPDPYLSEVVLNAMKHIPKLEPAMKDNKPVDCTFAFPCRFSQESSIPYNHVKVKPKTNIGHDRKN